VAFACDPGTFESLHKLIKKLWKVISRRKGSITQELLKRVLLQEMMKWKLVSHPRLSAPAPLHCQCVVLASLLLEPCGLLILRRMRQTLPHQVLLEMKIVIRFWRDSYRVLVKSLILGYMLQTESRVPVSNSKSDKEYLL
jgi:hypothetical protein